MDPLSVTASIAGIASLSGEVVHYLYKYAKAVRKSQGELLDLIAATEALSSVLRSCSKPSSGNHEDLFPAGSVGDLIKQRCSKDLNALLTQLTTIDGKSTVAKLLWPFRKEDFQEAASRIREYASTFEFAVTLDGRYVSHFSLNTLMRI